MKLLLYPPALPQTVNHLMIPQIHLTGPFGCLDHYYCN